jgi:hypothetical protein
VSSSTGLGGLPQSPYPQWAQYRTLLPISGYDPGMKLLIAVLAAGTLALIGLHLWVVHMHALFAAR